jgi:hypothetical protein
MFGVRSEGKASLIVALAAGFIWFTAPAGNAAVLVVGTCLGSSPYTTIGAAVSAASAGSTVHLCPGIYPEQVTITKALTVSGIASGGSDAAIVAAPAGGMVANAASLTDGSPYAVGIFVHDATGVTLSNLTVDSAGNQIGGCSPALIGILYQNASGTVNEVVARNQALAPADNECQSGLAIYVQSGVEHSAAGTSSVTVSNNSVHDYQKNGITGNNAGTTIRITGNTVRGFGETNGAAQNGIQIAVGAAGSVSGNFVADDVYSDPSVAAATGILIDGSSGVLVTSNVVGNTQVGVGLYSASAAQTANNTTVRTNTIFGTIAYDGVDACSNSNLITSNTITDSTESAIHLDDECGTTGNHNSVGLNTINEACAALLEGTATSGNSIGTNIEYNVVNQVLAGDTCTSSSAPDLGEAVTAKSESPRVEPFL